MIDKKPHIKPYLYGMLAGFGAISLSIIFFFLIYRFDGFGDAISTLTGILMPFIYGAVIAYLLKPVCNTIEAFLRRFIPEKMKGLINALSVTFTILFGLLLVYALFMMIVPQLITSVTTLYYTAQRNFAKFVQWANHVEFFEQNTQIMDLLKKGHEKHFCKLNAILTYREWLDDFASEETKKLGEAVIRKEIEEVRKKTPTIFSKKLYDLTMSYYERISNGERDLYI